MKKILLSLFVWFVWIICFCSWEWIYLEQVYSQNFTWFFWHEYFNINESFEYDLVCYKNVDCSSTNLAISFNWYDHWWYTNWVDNIDWVGYDWWWLWICTSPWETRISKTQSDCTISVYWFVYTWVDTNYCVSNNLCPEIPWSSASWSELVINDIVHQSAPLIDITIPQEFAWDYTVNENEFSMWVSWYNVDTEYIDWIITAQNVKPDSWTLNKIITELIPLFVPWLVIILFIWFVFRFVKKIF